MQQINDDITQQFTAQTTAMKNWMMSNTVTHAAMEDQAREMKRLAEQ